MLTVRSLGLSGNGLRREEEEGEHRGDGLSGQSDEEEGMRGGKGRKGDERSGQER